MVSNRSRRLRKKLYLDEFAMFGFEFNCKANVKTDEEHDDLIDSLLEFVESRNLMFGGGVSDGELSGFLCSTHRYQSATEEDRNALWDWLNRASGIEKAHVGELVDANYSF